MKIDTFTAITLTAIVGVSLALLSSVAGAEERYKHHCSTNKAKPTVINNAGKPLTPAIVVVQTRRYFPGVNPKIELEAKGAKRFFHSKFTKGGQLKQCYFRNKVWTAKAK